MSHVSKDGRKSVFRRSLNGLLASEIFWFCRPSADCISVFWFHNVLLLWSCSRRLLCILLWFCITERGSQNYERLYLFICLSGPSSVLLLLFPKLTNILRLIEYDPLTAVWNNEASFPHIFSPRMASLSCTSVHIKVPYQCGIWGWRNYWSHWEPRPPYLLLQHWGRDGIMEPKATLSESGDNGRTGNQVFFLVCFLLF